MADNAMLPGGLKPLGMTCTSTDCANGLHYFRPKPLQKRKATAARAATSQLSLPLPDLSVIAPAAQWQPPISPRGLCRACGADLVDWNRVTQRDLSDVAHTFEEMRKERIRHYFWHAAFDDAALRHALGKGMRGLDERAEREIRMKVGRTTGFDGRQTPLTGNVIHYAQHATATCCRKCIEEWHAIPKGPPLEEAEVAYLTDLVRLYIHERLPNLAEDAVKVPRRRRPSGFQDLAAQR